MDILIAIYALLIGIIMGIIGGGGSILTVPVMVYAVGITPVLATAYSLFIVGITALFGAANNYRQGHMDLRIAIYFAIPSLITVYLTRLLIIPALPEELLKIGSYILTKDRAIMMIFALLMLVAGLKMLNNKEIKVNKHKGERKFGLIILDGILLGLLTGIVGAGGGFLIIPALVLLAGLSMRKAIGTSLLIIAAKSLIGFLGDVQAGQLIDWKFLLMFSGISIVGILIGGKLGAKISNKKLRKSFAWFVIAMVIFIVYKEINN